MKVGLALPAGDSNSSGPTSLSQLAQYAITAEELGYDSVWLMDHFWIDRKDQRLAAHDPMIALTYIASRTYQIQLGTLVACNSFRHPAQLAREAAAIADASGGRFVLGLGAGWHEPEYAAFGIPFDHKVGRLAETLESVPRLLRGERITFSGDYLQLREAAISVSTVSPPLWIAGNRPRMLKLTARYADGWNSAWFGADPTPFRHRLGALWTAMDECGRRRDSIDVSAGIFVVPGPQHERVAAVALSGEAGEIAAGLRAYEEAGAQHLILSLGTAPFQLQDPSFVESVASAIGLAVR